MCGGGGGAGPGGGAIFASEEASEKKYFVYRSVRHLLLRRLRQALVILLPALRHHLFDARHALHVLSESGNKERGMCVSMCVSINIPWVNLSAQVEKGADVGLRIDDAEHKTKRKTSNQNPQKATTRNKL